MSIYRVSYNIPGCIPESGPEDFPTREAAIEAVSSEFDNTAEDAGLALDVKADIDALQRDGFLDDPRANGYRWNIEVVAGSQLTELHENLEAVQRIIRLGMGEGIFELDRALEIATDMLENANTNAQGGN